MNYFKRTWTILTVTALTVSCIQMGGMQNVSAAEEVPTLHTGGIRQKMTYVDDREEAMIMDEPSYVITGVTLSEIGSGYMYEMLETDEERVFYNRLLASALEVHNSDEEFTTTPGARYGDLGIDYERAKELAWIFHYDNPEFFWMKPHIRYGSYSGMKFVLYEDYQSGADRMAAKEEIDAITDEYIKAACRYETEFERADYLFDALYNDLSYGSNDLDQSAASAFLMKETVCAGCSKAYSILCNAVGVEAVMLLGYNHGWNAIKLGGTWYLADVTNGFFLLSEEEMLALDIMLGAEYTMTITSSDGTAETLQFYMHDINRRDYPVYCDDFPRCLTSYEAGAGDVPATTTEPLKTTTMTTTTATTTTTTTTTTSIDEPLLYKTGDPDGDGETGIGDATAVLREFARSAAGMSGELDEKCFAAADINGDGVLDIQDATLILMYYARAAAGMTVSWEELLAG